MNNSHIFPFLWLKGETQKQIHQEIEKIKESHIYEFVVESRTHPHFLEEGWWKDFEFILKTAEELNMRVWLLDDAHFPTGFANGAVIKQPQFKKKYLNFNTLDIFSEGLEMTLNLELLKKPRRKWSDRKQSETYYDELEKNEIISLTAYPLVEDGTVSEKGLDFNTFLGCSTLDYTFPKGKWRVIAVYKTSLNGGDPTYINMLEKDSVNLLIESIYESHFQYFGKHFGKTFRGFFSDEPGFGNTTGFLKDEIIGKKMMALPWGDTFEKEFLKNKITLKKLPFLWCSTQEKHIEKSIRLEYMNAITHAYSKNFSENIGKWCEDRNVLYIGHIIEDNNQHARIGTGAGHYFRAMKGQSMAGIDVIGGQITVGGENTYRTNNSYSDGEFYHYSLPKLADSDATLDPKKKGQAFCELFGAYGWQLTIRNMKFIVDLLINRGINNFTPHAFSMSPFPGLDSPPHFYANGHNPQFPLFGELMKYTQNLTKHFSGGKPVTKIAIFYHGELEWLGEYLKMQKISRILTENQIDFLYVSCDMLEEAVINNFGFQINGHQFEKLLIPYGEFIPYSLYHFMEKNLEDNVVFVQSKPKGIVDIDRVVENDFQAYPVVALEELPSLLKTYRHLGLTFASYSPKAAVRVYEKSNHTLIAVHNESLNDAYTYELTTKDQYIYKYNAFEDSYELVSGKNLQVLPYHMDIFFLTTQANLGVKKDSLVMTKEVDISTNWEVQLFEKEGYQPISIFQMDRLKSVANSFPNFSGIIEYRKIIDVQLLKREVFLEVERVFDGCEIIINGNVVNKLIAPPYIVKLTRFLQEGKNEVLIKVYTTADRGLSNHPLLLLMFEPSEPTGLVGDVTLKYFKEI